LIKWAPTFMDERFHPAPAEGPALKVLPLFCGGLGALTSGFIARGRRIGSSPAWVSRALPRA